MFGNSRECSKNVRKRFLKFVDKLKESGKTRKMFNLIKYDIRSVTGRNLRNIAILVNKDSIDVLNQYDADSISYQDIPVEHMWKVGLVREITDIKYGECFIDNFKRC